MKNIRHAYGMTQRELAEAIGVRVETISRIERGTQRISKRTKHELDLFVMEVEAFGEFDTEDIMASMESAQKAEKQLMRVMKNGEA